MLLLKIYVKRKYPDTRILKEPVLSVVFFSTVLMDHVGSEMSEPFKGSQNSMHTALFIYKTVDYSYQKVPIRQKASVGQFFCVI